MEPLSDPQSIEAEHFSAVRELVVLRGYLEFPLAHLSGFEIRVFARMGDRAAAMMIEVLDSLTLAQDVLVQKVLTALQVSFSSPECIADRTGRRPVATLRLLEALLSRLDSDHNRSLVRTAQEKFLSVMTSGSDSDG